MKFRWLWLGPIIWVGLFLLVYFLGEGSSWHRYFVRAEIETVKGLSFLGCLAAALAFGRGDHLRRAWLLMAAGTGVILLRDLTLIPWFEIIPHKHLVDGLLIFIANVFIVLCMVVFARTARLSGLALPGSSGERLGVLGLAVVISGALTGPTLYSHGLLVLRGDFDGLVAFSSALGDAISFCLLAPVLLTAVALRGGLAGVPWWFLTVGLGSWMFYDLSFMLDTYQVFSSEQIRPAAESFRALAFLYEFSAAVSQRLILRQITEK